MDWVIALVVLKRWDGDLEYSGNPSIFVKNVAFLKITQHAVSPWNEPPVIPTLPLNTYPTSFPQLDISPDAGRRPSCSL